MSDFLIILVTLTSIIEATWIAAFRWEYGHFPKQWNDWIPS